MNPEFPNIPWARLNVFNGSASTLPELIQTLLFGEHSAKESAYWSLEHLAAHDGDLYQAAYFVAQQIIGILRETSLSPDKHEAYGLLAWIAQSNGHGDSIVLPEGDLPRDLSAACRSIIWSGSELYLVDCLHHPSAKVRLGATVILYEFPEYRNRIIPVLQEALAKESDPDVTAHLRETISHLNGIVQ